jgi:hypothetical protein
VLEDNSCFICKDNFSNVDVHAQQNLICDSNVFIENCVLYDTKKKGNCKVCSNGYLVGDKSCDLVADAVASSLIADCETYEYARCKKCNAGFVRSLDGLTCISVASLDPGKTDVIAGTFTLLFISPNIKIV